MDRQSVFSVFNLLITVALFIAGTLVVRRVVWWYWGIDKHLANQREIIDTLKAQIELIQVIENQATARRTPLNQPSNPLTRK